ncbi:MAG: isoprenyl transferase [Candidatus Marinimicrobia bacterium]|nr:isoprenyl transferase [Candidatus Neomarinimicrobiota bacterium]
MSNSERKKTIQSYGNIPVHIAIIMDGNGRWAKERNLNRISGHREGINSVREITRIAGEIGVQHLTLYTFSTENWKRPRLEVSALMKLLLGTIQGEIDSLHKNNVRFTTIGDLGDLPKDARRGIENGIEKTKNNTGLNLNLALSYGSRQEILRAIELIARDVQSGSISLEDITEETVMSHLYTADMPDPDVLIRTGGEFRISNFLLWQSAYTELYMTETYWPDFREQQLLEAIIEFQSRERRFGKVSEQLRKVK